MPLFNGFKSINASHVTFISVECTIGTKSDGKCKSHFTRITCEVEYKS